MTTRITRKDLDAAVARLNKLTGSPADPYTLGADGRHHANPGNYHLSGAYGGWNVHRMVNEGGGVSCPISHGHIPARELFGLIHAYIKGIETARG